MDFSYYNSGLHTKAFYTECNIDFFIRDQYLLDKVKYNRKLLSKYYKEELEYIDDEDEKLEEIDRILKENLSYWSKYLKPLIYNEKIAFKCDLIPFEYEEQELLALSGCETDSSYKLDAYQLLTYYKIDPQSKVFTCRYYREDFENIVGKKITHKVLQMKRNLIAKN